MLTCRGKGFRLNRNCDGDNQQVDFTKFDQSLTNCMERDPVEIDEDMATTAQGAQPILNILLCK